MYDLCSCSISNFLLFECPEPCPWDRRARSALQRVRSWRSPGSFGTGDPLGNLCATSFGRETVQLKKKTTIHMTYHDNSLRWASWWLRERSVLGNNIVLGTFSLRVEISIWKQSVIWKGNFRKLHQTSWWRYLWKHDLFLRQASDSNLAVFYYLNDTWNERFGSTFQISSLETIRYTLPETNSSPLKMDGWNTSFLLGWPIFRCYVSFREGRSPSVSSAIDPWPWYLHDRRPHACTPLVHPEKTAGSFIIYRKCPNTRFVI